MVPIPSKYGASSIAASPTDCSNMPLGGVQQSGMRRDFGVDWVDAYVEAKPAFIRH
jgi:acyl-CoA reductase-like NAD-dependent aldehyde dehydrogenase